LSAYEKGKLYTLPTGEIQTDPDQPRKYLDPEALQELTASIAQHGILEPILFRQDEAGRLIVVAGERRLEAAKQAGLADVPAIFVEGSHAEIALVENLLRQDLTAVEEAEAMDRIMKVHGYTQETLAGVIGKARTTLNEILTLNRLPQEIRDECRNNPKITKTTLIEIARKKEVRGMTTAWRKYKDKVQKQQTGRKAREKGATQASALCSFLEKTLEKMAAADPSSWSDDEKNSVNTSLMALQEALRTFPI